MKSLVHADLAWKRELEARAAQVERVVPAAERRLAEQLAYEQSRGELREIDLAVERMRSGYWMFCALLLMAAWLLRWWWLP